MIYRQDLSEAAYRRDIGFVEAAFSALLGSAEDAVEDPDTAMLIDCCRALAGHDAIMPDETVDAINAAARTEPEERLPYGSSFGAGAARVWREIDRFAPLFGEAPRG